MVVNTKVAILGAGPGGYTAAFLAADLGMDVTLIDLEKNPGGVCLYKGCIPSKALLHIAKLLEETKHAKKWGIDFGEPQIDIKKVKRFKDKVIAKLTGGTGQLVKQRKINYIQGRGQFINSTTIQVEKVDGTTEEVVFEKAILATGSEPVRIPGLWIDSPNVIDSTGALELNDVPEKMLVLGGGIIGLEMATVYASLGSKVSVVEMMPQLIPGADLDLVSVLTRSLTPRLDKIMLNTKVLSVEETDEGIKVTFDGEKVKEKVQVFDKVLMSIGRRPVTKGLGIENTQIQIDEKGFVIVDDQLKTSDANIYAIGDLVGNPMLAHKASAEGKVAVEHIAGHKVAFDHVVIPSVVYTDPELAWAGLTENEAAEKGINVEVQKFPWAASGRAVTMDRNDGMTKILADPETGRIMGMGLVGPGAGEMISEGALAIEMAALVKDVALTIHPHPTISETVMETAEMFFGQSTHIYKPKK
ncbi:MAG: dihydrolipoyl dehydrogenase [Melioribacteraceae bacterium]|nr:dihydrolipoyl dehydrogenase [Melioribacteraceae bacterium]